RETLETELGLLRERLISLLTKTPPRHRAGTFCKILSTCKFWLAPERVVTSSHAHSLRHHCRRHSRRLSLGNYFNRYETVWRCFDLADLMATKRLPSSDCYQHFVSYDECHQMMVSRAVPMSAFGKADMSYCTAYVCL